MAERDAAAGGYRVVTKAHLPGQSILDVLRPPVGWKTDRALLSSYSADPAVIAAALLALAARDDDGGSGTRAGLARALLELRGRVAFILQRGRIAAPRRGGLVLGMLDRFVREVPWNEGREDDEQGRSWHPKLAMLRYVPETGGNARWRLWLGSRNLTRDTSWDVGLTVEGQAEGAGQLLPGFPELVERLASAAGESQEWARHLPEAAALRWEVPRGLRLERVALHLPGDEGRSYPQEPAGLSELFAVSPFLDGTTVNHFGGWGDGRSRKILLSTHDEFARLAGQQAQPLARFADLLALPAATFEPEQSNAEETVEENMEGRGLHAKFVWAEHAVGATLWLGSANLTRRGWTRNAEVVAEVAVERRGSARAAVSLIEGIRAFRDQCVTIRLADLPAAAEPDEVMERLEAARRTIAAHLDARQHVQADGGTLVVSPRPPHPGDSDIRLSVARLTGAAVTWAVDATSARLPPVRGGSGWEASTERSLLPADPARPNVFALFHPSPLLTGLDPLQARRPGELAIRQSMMAQLSAVLSRHGISVVARGPRARPLPPWQTLAALETRTGHWQASRAAWQQVVGELRAERGDVTAGQRLEQTLDRWGEAGTETDVSVLDEEEVRAVAQLALEAPGVVLARAVARHWSEERTTSLPLVASLSWRGLRTYLDNPWFASTLGGSRGEHYPDAIRIAVRQGNLEAVLDEHFWYLAQTGVGTWPERLAAFASALRLRTGNTTLHEAPGQSFRLRCHAAAALTETRQAARTAGSDETEQQIRPEEVRHAFNTPFWPHVLATTSIGQEGLDFHPWCRAVAHWDLPPGPVALEQREGRVSRHAGLAVRRAIGAQLGKGRRWGSDSPWVTLARLAETEWADQMGLSPWWIAPGASIQRLLLSLPGSELEERMLGLSKERALYRVALGMPDQGDLVSLILDRQAAPSAGLGELCIDLAAFADPASAA
ncbi:hypothetical protein [Roseomonas rosulenta]|uniref:hypothetical protein n=1 Tax=Roseomonas rosulenta TaxID=2748667 RepID=UPI0018DFB2EA|nr:hypothetical protein [Roseomonas rosulenta]